MIEQRCQTCKWWATIDNTYRLRPDWGECDLTILHDGTEAKHSTSRALAEDKESYSAVLITAPDFGCVQHEPRDDDQTSIQRSR